VYGFLPPHPNNPPTKRPLVQLMKQARAFGVGVLIATQNPMDLDYRALSNASVWALGTLQTDADRERVIEGLASGDRKADQVSRRHRATTRQTLVRDARHARRARARAPATALRHDVHAWAHDAQ
jgi:DNA helicase HerA-like ATPase